VIRLALVPSLAAGWKRQPSVHREDIGGGVVVGG